MERKMLGSLIVMSVNIVKIIQKSFALKLFGTFVCMEN